MAQSPPKLSAAKRRRTVATGASPWKRDGAGKRAPEGRWKPSNNGRPPFTLTINALTGAAQGPFLRRHLRAAQKLLNSTLTDLQVILVNDQFISRLHHQFMGQPSPTDVLTFPLDLDPSGRPLSAEIYINVNHARRESRRRNLPLQHELLLYALHGMLHLIGYDDRTDRDFARMHQKEDQILEQLGIGTIFARLPLAASHRSNRAKPPARARPK